MIFANKQVSRKHTKDYKFCISGTSEEEQLKAALEMSMQADETSPEPTPVSTEPPQAPSGMSDFSMLTEDEQIALAMQLSMSETPSGKMITPP